MRRLMHNGRRRMADWLRVAGLGAGLFAAGFLFHLPFWLGFRSQASGFLPNIINPTSTPQFFLMFRAILLLLAPFLALEVARAGGA